MPRISQPAILHVDLTTAATRRLDAPGALLSRAPGGRALAGVLWQAFAGGRTSPGAAPFVCAAAALAGCDLPGCGHVALAFFSPRALAPAIASLGGGLGHALARAGLAAVVVTGRAAAPVGLRITDDDARLVDAATLRGRPVTALRGALGDGGAGLVAGPAAFAGSGLATLVSDDGLHDAGGAGSGRALADKNCVFMAVHGGQAVLAPADPEALVRAGEAMGRLIAAAPALSGPCGFGRHGTAALVDLTAGRRMQPTDNFRATFFPPAAMVNAPALGKRFQSDGRACPGCPVPCRRVDAAGRLLPDVDALSHATALLGLADPDLAVFARQFCLEQGLDAASALAAVAAWAEVRGVAPTASGVREALYSLAAGDARGRDIESGLSLTVKGMALPAFDPRGAYGLALSLAVAPSGPDPWAGGCLAHELLRKPVATDRFTFEGKARAVALGEDAQAAAQSLGGCPWLSLAITLEEWALAWAAFTGEAVTAGGLAALGRDVVLAERVRAARFGRDATADDLPDRFFTCPGTGGDGFAVPALDREAFLLARSKYYRLRGLDAHGRPGEALPEVPWTP